MKNNVRNICTKIINVLSLTYQTETNHLIEKQNKMKVQEMTQSEFATAFKNADDRELVADNISKRWSIEEGGYWYVANEGDCDGGDTINFWFESDQDENGYVEELGARI